jgi:uncharacterized protein YbbC (DUF1343 family)
MANGASTEFMPWTIAPASDIPGFFTPYLYSGGGLWNNTNITPAIGTARPYEYIGAPFIKHSRLDSIPTDPGAHIRPCSFTPSTGRYAGQWCYGYQILLVPGENYHSLMHTLRLIRYFKETYPAFEIDQDFYIKLADPVLEEYIKGGITFDIVREHIKTEEQKWIRKAKKFTLYDNQPFRMK